MYWLTGKRKSKRWPPVKTYVVILHLRNRPFTRLHKNKKHTVLKSEMIFWGSQGVKLGWKQQPYKIRVRPCEALIQLYHISSKYKGNLEHMNIHHTWGNWANIMQVYLCRYLSSLSYVRVYGQCIYSPLPLAASRWLFDATNWHFLIIAHQQPQHFCWESNFFSESKRCFSPADATKEQNIHHESLLLLLLLRQSGPELRCVCCALIVTDGTLKTAIFDTRDKNIDNAIKIKPYCRICAVNSNTGDPWIHTVWSVRWTFFFLLIISSQVFFWGWAGLLGHGWINILTYLRAPF